MPALPQHCPVCSTNTWEDDTFAAQMLGLIPAYTVRLCKKCGQRCLDPKLSQDELTALYSDAYFNSSQVTQLPTKRQGTEIASSDYITEVAPSRHEQYGRTIRELKDLHSEARTFLDVGAATGDMVKIALEHGLTADGIELSDFAVRKARELYSINLRQNVLAELDKDGYYDLIHLNHVFEHFNDPAAELEHLCRLLKYGGVIFIEIPYQFNVLDKLLFKLKGKRPSFSVHSLHHPYFYTPHTIKRLLRQHGFEIMRHTVFEPERYPSDTPLAMLKFVAWRILSLFSIGGYIRLYAKRCN